MLIVFVNRLSYRHLILEHYWDMCYYVVGSDSVLSKVEKQIYLYVWYVFLSQGNPDGDWHHDMFEGQGARRNNPRLGSPTAPAGSSKLVVSNLDFGVSDADIKVTINLKHLVYCKKIYLNMLLFFLMTGTFYGIWTFETCLCAL